MTLQEEWEAQGRVDARAGRPLFQVDVDEGQENYRHAWRRAAQEAELAKMAEEAAAREEEAKKEEDIKQGLAREIEEETGLQIKEKHIKDPVYRHNHMNVYEIH